MVPERYATATPLGKNLARRNQTIVPVGAWVELSTLPKRNEYGVFVSAQIEEERISSKQREKTAKLEQFQKEVRERVREAHRRRREQRLQESSHAVDLHQRILHRGHRGQQGGEKIYREGSIQISSDQEDVDGAEGAQENVDPDHLVSLSQKIGGLVKMAKRDLASRRVMAEKSNIPGGTWGQSFSRDTVGPKVSHVSEYGDNTAIHTSDDVPLSTSMTTRMVHSYDTSPGDPGADSHPGTPADPGISGDPRSSREPCTCHNQVKGQCITHQRMHPQSDRPKTVTFDPRLDPDHKESNRAESEPTGRLNSHSNESQKLRGTEDVGNIIQLRSKSEKGSEKYLEGIDLRPGLAEEERRRRVREEVSNYRRLFMDLERQAVQENRRKKQHSKHIERLKKAKEEERLAVERQSEIATEPTDPITGLTGGELIKERKWQERRVGAEMERHRERERRDMEMKRYIRALRAQMKEKVDSLGIVLPPLCPCGVTAWDCGPDTCANNCVFYRNPKAYAKALASLLNSSEFG